MEPSRCRAFLAAAEHGSFARAAEELNYTTSGVSQLVAALEKELGFALFTRKKKGVELNAEGKQMLPTVRAFVQQERSIYQVAAEIRGLSVGGDRDCLLFKHFNALAPTGDQAVPNGLPEYTNQAHGRYPAGGGTVAGGIESRHWFPELWERTCL